MHAMSATVQRVSAQLFIKCCTCRSFHSRQHAAQHKVEQHCTWYSSLTGTSKLMAPADCTASNNTMRTTQLQLQDTCACCRCSAWGSCSSPYIHKQHPLASKEVFASHVAFWCLILHATLLQLQTPVQGCMDTASVCCTCTPLRPDMSQGPLGSIAPSCNTGQVQENTASR